jgi:hypothetical protein
VNFGSGVGYLNWDDCNSRVHIELAEMDSPPDGTKPTQVYSRHKCLKHGLVRASCTPCVYEEALSVIENTKKAQVSSTEDLDNDEAILKQAQSQLCPRHNKMRCKECKSALNWDYYATDDAQRAWNAAVKYTKYGGKICDHDKWKNNCKVCQQSRLCKSCGKWNTARHICNSTEDLTNDRPKLGRPFCPLEDERKQFIRLKARLRYANLSPAAKNLFCKKQYQAKKERLARASGTAHSSRLESEATLGTSADDCVDDFLDSIMNDGDAARSFTDSFFTSDADELEVSEFLKSLEHEDDSAPAGGAGGD